MEKYKCEPWSRKRKLQEKMLNVRAGKRKVPRTGACTVPSTSAESNLQAHIEASEVAEGPNAQEIVDDEGTMPSYSL